MLLFSVTFFLAVIGAVAVAFWLCRPLVNSCVARNEAVTLYKRAQTARIEAENKYYKLCYETHASTFSDSTYVVTGPTTSSDGSVN